MKKLPQKAVFMKIIAHSLFSVTFVADFQNNHTNLTK